MSEFLKRVLSKMVGIDTLDVEPFSVATENLLRDLAKDLNEIVDIFERFDATASSHVVNLTDRKLETNNKEFLDRLSQYIEGVDRAFNARGVRYGMLCKQLMLRSAKESDKTDTLAILHKIAASESSFRNAIARVSKLSIRKLKESEDLGITKLAKYEYQFKQLRLFATLTWLKALELLIKQGSVTASAAK